MKNSEQRAFPADSKTQSDGGLSKREYFAAMAMQGLLANPMYANEVNRKAKKADGDYCMDADLAERSVEIADALLNQLESQTQKDKEEL